MEDRVRGIRVTIDAACNRHREARLWPKAADCISDYRITSCAGSAFEWNLQVRGSF